MEAFWTSFERAFPSRNDADDTIDQVTEHVPLLAFSKLPVAVVTSASHTEQSALLTLRNLDEGLGHAVASALLLDENVLFAAYNRPHPLQNEHIIRIDTHAPHAWRAAWRRALSALTDFVHGVDATPAGEWLGHIDFARTPPSWINALRRTLLTEIPTLAVTECVMEHNTTVIPDETLMQRLALCPVRTPVHLGALADAGGQNGDFTMELDVSLASVSQQGVSKRSQRTVTNADVRMRAPEACYINVLRTRDGVREPDKSRALPIAVLMPGQRIALEAVLSMGTGAHNARFSAASPISYQVAAAYDDGEYVDARLALEMVGQLTFQETVAAGLHFLRKHLQTMEHVPGV